MSDYIITNDNELYHYGVKGMRWGVRRNTKRLNSGDSAKSEKAAKALQKHRDKGSAKIEKLKKKGAKLEKSYEKAAISNEASAAKLHAKAAKLQRRAFKRSTSKDRADSLLYEAKRLESIAIDLKAKTKEAKAKVERNDMLISQFEKEIKNIDQALVNRGKEYLKDKDD